MPLRRILLVILLASASVACAQRSGGPPHGTLVLDGGGATDAVKDRFISLSGGTAARVVVIPTAASSIRFGSANTILDPDASRTSPEWLAYEAWLKSWLGTEKLTVLHTRDRRVADSEAFAKPIAEANAVYLAAGNPGRLADTYRGTRTEKALHALLERGGIVFGSSAGAIIMGSFIVRGRPDKPLLMVKGHDRGFGFLHNVAVNPHLTQAKRESELVNVVDAHPNLLGIGLDEDAGMIVRANCLEAIGSGRVAIYDNELHAGGWYYWLKPGERLDLASRQKSACSP